MEKRWIINTVKSHHNDAEKVSKLIEKVVERGGIAYAREKMIEYRQKSLEILMSFPDNEYRKSLEQLVLFTTERNA
jgi:octaprenyl-diphosphate synthase